MIIYLIGPSGVGKSVLVTKASDVFSQVMPKRIDELCKGYEFNWKICEATLLDIENKVKKSKICIIDIGAGTQTIQELQNFLRPRSKNVVLIYGLPKEVLPRNPLGCDRDPQEFFNTEYLLRRDLYSLAVSIVDVSGKDKKEAEDQFISFLQEKFCLLEVGSSFSETK